MKQPTQLYQDTSQPTRPVLTSLVVLTGVFLSSLDLFIVNIAFPAISLNFHGEGLSSLSWILSAYTIVFAALLVPAGRWADRAERKGAAIALWSAVGGAAAALGPPIGGLLVQASWRWVFLVNLPFALLALVVGIRVLGEVKDPAAHKSDLLGAGLLSVAVASLVAAIVKGPDWGWSSTTV